MDSSPKNVTVNDLTPWQLGRLRDRLMNYKAAHRHGWERIATDILYEEELPEDYVDSEEVRPLSESLRRWFNGSQTPNAQRLEAVRIFLIAQGYLDGEALEEINSSLQAPLAFVEYITGGNDAYRDNLSRFAAFEGGFSLVKDFRSEVYHELLTLRFQNGYFLVTYQMAILKNIDTVNRLVNTPSVRRRAMTRQDTYEGWATCGPFGEIVIFVNEPAFAQKPKFFLLWAEKKREDQASPAEEIMLMPYDGVRGAETLKEVQELLDGPKDEPSDLVEARYIRPSYEIFERI